MNVGETLEVKLSIDEYVKISDEDDPCMDQDNYSANNASTIFLIKRLITFALKAMI